MDKIWKSLFHQVPLWGCITNIAERKTDDLRLLWQHHKSCPPIDSPMASSLLLSYPGAQTRPSVQMQMQALTEVDLK
ncbi:hypothetical protein FVEG_14840 [Fusarium verticillioides 7600]|uniref:Uncharacterized protein n=1 Tax=Gibberella moniliformis (strain M3125 / FGSC 7600) TaxID=334819 RepID=W7LHZ4_GIBM7|nr:hypothetical protein FVEG_14840 [Fusarium verticillioides 7600]EWG38121.1 hypothetical protein FVEG_14840 [Fusarium verticillioides 7600]